MKRKLWWTLLGVPGIGLAAAMWGQTVWGQPDTKLPVLPNRPTALPADQPKAFVPPPNFTVEVAPGDPKPHFPPMPKAPGLPAPPPVQGAPLTPPPTTTIQPAPGEIVRTESVRLNLPANKDGITYEVAPGRQQSAVSVEWAAPQAVRIHQPMSCQLIVRNTSASTVQNVVVRHRLGQGVVCKNAEPQAVQNGSDLTWNLGTLAPEQTRKINLVVVAGARGVLHCNAAVTFTTVSGHHVQVREPMLAIKMRSPENIVSGDNVTLLVAISNPGDAATEAIKVKAILPEGLEHSRGRQFDVDVGNLAPQESRTMQLVCLAKGTGVQKCEFVATANDNLRSTDAGQFEILTAKLDVALSGPKLRYLDRHAVYTLKVTNPGSATANRVEVHEVIPPGFKFHQANHGGKFDEQGRFVTWNLGDLQPGQSKDVAVDLVPIEAGEHRIVAHARTLRGLKSEAETRTLVEGLSSLQIDVTHVDDPIEVGAESAFEIRLVNTGTKMESNVQVVCMLPDQLAFRGAKCSTTLRYRQEGQQLIFEPLTKLAPKADVIYRVQVKGVAPGDVRFRTKISADGLKDPMLREESMRIYRDDAPLRTITTSSPAAILTPSPTPTPAQVAPQTPPEAAPLAPRSNVIVPTEWETQGTPRINDDAPIPILPTPPATGTSQPPTTPSFPPGLPAPNGLPTAPPALPPVR